jgi:hypothetical protein
MYKQKKNLKTKYNMKTRTSIYYRVFAYVLLVAVIFCGCEIPKQKYTKNIDEYDDVIYDIHQIDSCEYVTSLVYGGTSICHKGNCKFCAERSKK